MKRKTILSIMAIVMVVAMLSTCLVACNKDDNTAKASNAETLGTAIAMAANTAAGASGASAAEGESDEGLNINVSASGAASIAVNGAISAITPALEAALQSTVNNIECFVNENGVKVETLAADSAEFVANSDYTIKVSVTYADENEETVTDVYYVAVDTNGADIEGTTGFDFTIAVYVQNNDEAVYSVSGKATYKSDVDGLAFSFNADLGIAGASVTAYATKSGTIAIDINAEAGVLGTGVTAGVKVELGKLADNKYGAAVTVSASASVTGIGVVNATVKANVIAEKVEDTHDFAIDGTVEVKLIPAAGDSNYVAKANITGNATYDATTDQFVVSVSGAASVTTEAKESK